MLFNSYEFLIFLPLVFMLYWSLHKQLRLQNLLLVGASYVFYGWWNVHFLWLIIGITLAGYLAGIGIRQSRPGSRTARFVCGLCIVVCLGILGAFKYHDFFVDSFNTLMSQCGFSVCLPLWNILLPVGISFYTFQVLSYAIDVYRKKLEACTDIVSFAAFVSFFPQLVAGPIERATHLLPQMQRPRHLAYADAADGLRQMLWGFVKKMLIADRCAPIVNAIYSNPQADGTDLWMGAILFAFQIYGDFSGYSDIAIGTARLFGIRLTQNFNVPYFARDVAEFWRRWHISLMSWFKDYVYIPLGGSRCSLKRHLLNTTVVFLVSGLWHGANWTFVVWGAYQAVWFIPLILNGKRHRHTSSVVAENSMLPSVKETLQMLSTFFIICIGWVFFRSENLFSAFDRLGRMFSDLALHSPYGGLSSLYPIIGLVIAEWCMRRRRYGLDFQGKGLLRYRTVRWSLYYLLIFATLYWGGRQSAFIYFQF